MNKDTKPEIVFIGGDIRAVYAAKRMSSHYSCTLIGFDALDPLEPALDPAGKYDAAVLPIFAGGIKEIRCPYSNKAYDIGLLPMLLKPGAFVFAGNTFPALEKLCEDNGFGLCDYLAREELAVLNAQLTAEGAVGTAIRETESSVHGANVLILGFGRIGKLCARYFSALGAEVTAAARKKRDIAWIAALGYFPTEFDDTAAFESALGRADIIINTVPAKVLTGAREKAVRSDALLIELASVPCTEESSHIRTVKAGGLPGKTAPLTAGNIIAGTIENILSERSVKNGEA